MARQNRLSTGALGVSLLLTALGGTAGCASDRVRVSVPHVERVDVRPFPTQSVANREISARAEAFAAQLPGGATTWYGNGLSMEPLLAPGSWVVVQPITFGELQAGMVVLYVTGEGRPVAHALVRASAAGWVAVGVNNRRIDRERVTPLNLVGVVCAAFQPETSRL